MSLNQSAALAVLLAVIIYALVAAKALLAPFVIALIIWYLLIVMAKFICRLSPQVPMWGALLLSMVVACGLLYGLYELMSTSINEVVRAAPRYQEKLTGLLSWINAVTNHQLMDVNGLVSQLDLPGLFTDTALALSSIGGNLGLIIVYILFLLLEYRFFDVKLKAFFGEKHKKYDTTRDIIDHINRDINRYLGVKILTSGTTAVISYFVMWAFSLDFAAFWAVLVFLLNFIPNVGSIVATAFPIIVSLAQFGSLATTGALGGILVAVQFMVGNLLEPKMMGRSLNISAVVILLSLAFWGSIWGIMGMVLCVPFTVVIMIIFARFPATKRMAILMSSDGKL